MAEEISPRTPVEVQLVGQNGNVFNLASIVTQALKREGYYQEAQEVKTKLFECKSYDEALRLFMDYVHVN